MMRAIVVAGCALSAAPVAEAARNGIVVPSTCHVPKIFQPFVEAKEKLGKGGYGTVWRVVTGCSRKNKKEPGSGPREAALKQQTDFKAATFEYNVLFDMERVATWLGPPNPGSPRHPVQFSHEGQTYQPYAEDPPPQLAQMIDDYRQAYYTLTDDPAHDTLFSGASKMASPWAWASEAVKESSGVVEQSGLFGKGEGVADEWDHPLRPRAADGRNDFGAEARQFRFSILMEYCPGKTLDRAIPDSGTNGYGMLRTDKFHPLLAASITVDLLEALAILNDPLGQHRIHRDIKPANIGLTANLKKENGMWVCGDPQNPLGCGARLLDPGLACKLPNNWDDPADLAKVEPLCRDIWSQNPVGQMNEFKQGAHNVYVLPTDCGSRNHIDFDVWSVGILLFRMLTGEVPGRLMSDRGNNNTLIFDKEMRDAALDGPEEERSKVGRGAKKKKNKKPKSPYHNLAVRLVKGMLEPCGREHGAVDYLKGDKLDTTGILLHDWYDHGFNKGSAEIQCTGMFHNEKPGEVCDECKNSRFSARKALQIARWWLDAEMKKMPQKGKKRPKRLTAKDTREKSTVPPCVTQCLACPVANEKHGDKGKCFVDKAWNSAEIALAIYNGEDEVCFPKDAKMLPVYRDAWVPWNNYAVHFQFWQWMSPFFRLQVYHMDNPGVDFEFGKIPQLPQGLIKRAQSQQRIFDRMNPASDHGRNGIESGMRWDAANMQLIMQDLDAMPAI